MTRLLRKHSLSRSACLSEAVHRISLRTSGKQSSTLLKLSTEREKSRQVDKAVTEATRFPLVNRQISEKRNVAKHHTKDKRIIIIDNVQLRKKEKNKNHRTSRFSYFSLPVEKYNLEKGKLLHRTYKAWCPNNRHQGTHFDGLGLFMSHYAAFECMGKVALLLKYYGPLLLASYVDMPAQRNKMLTMLT